MNALLTRLHTLGQGRGFCSCSITLNGYKLEPKIEPMAGSEFAHDHRNGRRREETIYRNDDKDEPAVKRAFFGVVKTTTTV